MKTFLSVTLAMWFKKLGIAGALRWRILYWTYKLWPGLHIRHKEWDWVLNYLPALGKWQDVSVMDVGATSSLFIYEIARRGYNASGIDIRPYQEEHKGFRFWLWDIASPEKSTCAYDFVTCISVLEHIPKDKQHDAFDNMMALLKPGGRLLLTIPTREFSQGHDWEGFDITDFDLHEDKARIVEYTERMGQICMAVERIA